MTIFVAQNNRTSYDYCRNPIYDAVFKYLMEDERIARTILSALLKKDIIRVEVRPHEYSNTQRGSLSIYRIDFGATIREADGSEHLILIELQKTWLPTETLRFRQYLGVQYENPRNIVNESADQHALPMVAVYLLGHKVGDIEEPVIYVRHQTFDYNGRPVTKGLPNAFVDSLTHDSIIVQIPRLHGQINNRLDEVLSVFDQTRQDADDQKMLCLDDSLYPEDDADMQRILRRLLMAATDADMRMDMNVENEYYSIIEKQDTEILQHKRELEEKEVQLAKKDAQLELQESQLAQQESQLAQQESQLAQQENQLAQQESQLAQQESQLAQKDALLRTSVQMLMKAGMPLESIAAQLNITVEAIQELL